MTSATGVLLVGGASSRFGSPKPLAPFGGETLAERAWRILGEAFEARLAVGKGDLELPFAVVVEPAEPRAPIVGVIAGLRAAATDVAVFLPVDCPLVTPALCASWASGAARHADGAAARRLREGRSAASSSAGWRQADWSLRGLNPRVIEADRRLLANANTTAELSALEQDLAALDEHRA